MLTRQRLVFYQLLLSLISTVCALCNPPRRFEAHLRSLEAVGNLVLFYLVLGGYAFFVFSLLYGLVFSLVLPLLIWLFHTLARILEACHKSVSYLNVRAPQIAHLTAYILTVHIALQYGISVNLHRQCHARVRSS